MAENNLQDVEVKTPFGSLAAKGVRVSDIIALLTLLGVALGAYAFYLHADDAKTATVAVTKVVTEQTISNKEQAQGLRYMACIIAEDQKDRKNARAECREQSRMP